MTRKPLILIADDDRHIREALCKRLAQCDFTVVTADDAHTAIELFDRTQPDAAILDVRMPDSDGLAVCQHIRESGSAIPVFFLTGADEGIIRNHLGRLSAHVGANHFLTKPYDGQQLAMMLHQALNAAIAQTATLSLNSRSAF